MGIFLIALGGVFTALGMLARVFEDLLCGCAAYALWQHFLDIQQTLPLKGTGKGK